MCFISFQETLTLYDFVGNLLRSYDSRSGNLPQRFDELIFIAMVNATKTWKTDEDTFWECIYKKLIGTGGSQKIYTYLSHRLKDLVL